MSTIKSQSETIIPFYPVLFAVYPVTTLLAGNLGQVRLLAGLRPGLVSLVGAIIIYLGLRLLLRDWTKAALLSGLALLLFFSYGHIYGILEPTSIAGFHPGRHRLLAPLWLAFFGIGAWFVVRSKHISTAWSQPLNLVSLALVVMSTGQLVYGEVRGNMRANATIANLSSKGSPQNQGVLQAAEDSPDMYYIILDGYTRNDALQQDYGFDNNAFQDQLRQLGFVIPRCAQSNYAYTSLSLSSTFFMDYLENFTDFLRKGDSSRDWVAYQEYLMHNPVRQNFRNLGYKEVAFETGYWWADITDADYFVTGNNNPVLKWKSDHDLNDFEDMFVRTTALRVLVEASTSMRAKVAPTIRTVEERRYDTVNFVLDQMADVPRIPGPKFVYVHIVAPHPPFVFDEQGEYRVTKRDTEGYVPEVKYLNGRVIEAIRSILEQSTMPPIIVLQGDHGWTMQNRMKILNAYYLPGEGSQKVYDTITPVNTFRLIFDRYFGGKYGLLPDTSYFSTEEAIYQFKVEPSTCAQGK